MDKAPEAIASTGTPDPPGEHPAGCACCSGADACARAERQLRSLAELAEIELAMTRLVRAEAEAVPEPAPAAPDADRRRPAGPNPHAALVLRFARSVRQTFALEAKLAKEHRDWSTGVEAERAKRRAAARQDRVLRHKAAVVVALQRAEEAQAISMEQCAEIVVELEERLDHEEEFPGLVDQPTGEIVTAICEDHGIDLAWDRWAPDPDEIATGVVFLLRQSRAEAGRPPIVRGRGPPPAPG